MHIIKTADHKLHGHKYCIQDKRGNIIAVLPTKQSQEKELELIGEVGDSVVEILFINH
tara:strand:+ start:149 stop:322 length:174 start_codon:yes stop_codon:yes gene_type:complete